MTDILILAVIGTFIGVLVPESKGDSMRRLVSLIAGLSILLAVAKPFADAADEIRQLPERMRELLFPSWEEGEAFFSGTDDWVEQRGIRNVESGVRTLICTRWQLEEADVSVSLRTARDNGGSIVIEAVEVMIDAPCDAETVEQYIADLLACPCHVQISKER